MVRGLGLTIPAISTTRKNLIDPERGAGMVACVHRVIDSPFLCEHYGGVGVGATDRDDLRTLLPRAPRTTP